MEFVTDFTKTGSSIRSVQWRRKYVFYISRKRREAWNDTWSRY